VLDDERGWDAQYLIPQPPKVPVAANIGDAALSVVGPIHLDNEPDRRRHKVHDVASAERDLPPKLHPQFAGPQLLPKPRLRLRRRAAISPSVLLELNLPLMGFELFLRCTL
jgi:hypothetical protein